MEQPNVVDATPLTQEELIEGERLAFIAAIEESLADPRPDIPHEVVREEIMAKIRNLERRIKASR